MYLSEALGILYAGRSGADVGLSTETEYHLSKPDSNVLQNWQGSIRRGCLLRRSEHIQQPDQQTHLAGRQTPLQPRLVLQEVPVHAFF